MREVVSQLMLAIDELWLSYAEYLREQDNVDVIDVHLEDALFNMWSELELKLSTLRQNPVASDGDFDSSLCPDAVRTQQVDKDMLQEEKVRSNVARTRLLIARQRNLIDRLADCGLKETEGVARTVLGVMTGYLEVEVAVLGWMVKGRGTGFGRPQRVAAPLMAPRVNDSASQRRPRV